MWISPLTWSYDYPSWNPDICFAYNGLHVEVLTLCIRACDTLGGFRPFFTRNTTFETSSLSYSTVVPF